ncbi:MAG: hypothetical protein ACRCVT_11785 [Leadbetterella sp.]
MNNRFKYLLLVLVLGTVAACKSSKDKVKPQGKKCNLLAVNDQSRNLRSLEWVSGKVVRVIMNDDGNVSTLNDLPSTAVFKYNSKNQIVEMDILPEGETDRYIIKLTYDSKGTVTKSNVTIAGWQFLENQFSYNEKKDLTSVKCSYQAYGRVFTSQIRLQYFNGNVTKVTEKIDDLPEQVSYEGLTYDDKIQYLPDAFKTMALGMVGLENRFFTYFGTNNMTKGKFYNDEGKLDQETTITYTYDTNGMPKQSESIAVQGGKKKVEVCSYVFGCK